MKSLISLMVLLSSLTAFAGHRGGNGGDAVVCGDNVRILDEVEAPRDGLVYRVKETLNYREQIDQILTDLDLLSPDLSNMIKGDVYRLIDDIDAYISDRNGPKKENYVYNSITFTRDTLTDVKDSGHISLPEGCELKQIVTQRQNTIGTQRRYVFNTTLFNELNNKSIASLVLHEAIYKFMTTQVYSQDELKNSVKVRYFNNMISSQYYIDEIVTNGAANAIRKLVEIGIRKIIINGETHNFKTYPEGGNVLEINAGSLNKFIKFTDVNGDIAYLYGGRDVNGRKKLLYPSLPLKVKKLKIYEFDYLCQEPVAQPSLANCHYAKWFNSAHTSDLIKVNDNNFYLDRSLFDESQTYIESVFRYLESGFSLANKCEARLKLLSPAYRVYQSGRAGRYHIFLSRNGKVLIDKRAKRTSKLEEEIHKIVMENCF